MHAHARNASRRVVSCATQVWQRPQVRVSQHVHAGTGCAVQARRASHVPIVLQGAQRATNLAPPRSPHRAVRRADWTTPTVRSRRWVLECPKASAKFCTTSSRPISVTPLPAAASAHTERACMHACARACQHPPVALTLLHCCAQPHWQGGAPRRVDQGPHHERSREGGGRPAVRGGGGRRRCCWTTSMHAPSCCCC